jgi:hypothetical protein
MNDINCSGFIQHGNNINTPCHYKAKYIQFGHYSCGKHSKNGLRTILPNRLDKKLKGIKNIEVEITKNPANKHKLSDANEQDNKCPEVNDDENDNISGREDTLSTIDDEEIEFKISSHLQTLSTIENDNTSRQDDENEEIEFKISSHLQTLSTIENDNISRQDDENEEIEFKISSHLQTLSVLNSNNTDSLSISDDY